MTSQGGYVIECSAAEGDQGAGQMLLKGLLDFGYFKESNNPK